MNVSLLRRLEKGASSWTLRRQAALRSVAIGCEGYQPGERATGWGLVQIAGRWIEITGSGATACLTAAFGLVLDAQRRGEPVAWIGLPPSMFFPPDAASGGVDLHSLAVVRAPDARTAIRAAIQLTRSGGIGLVVIDLCGPVSTKKHAGELRSIPSSLMTRLVGLAQKQMTAVVALTEKPERAGSLSSLVSLRVEARRSERGEIYLSVLKDKRRGPGEVFRESCRVPAGMC